MLQLKFSNLFCLSVSAVLLVSAIFLGENVSTICIEDAVIANLRQSAEHPPQKPICDPVGNHTFCHTSHRSAAVISDTGKWGKMFVGAYSGIVPSVASWK